jgi:3-dehydroquinate synthase
METRILSIDLDTRAYDIYIGAGLINRVQDFLPDELEGRAVFIVTDTNVQPYATQVKELLMQNGAARAEMITMQAGEKTKSFANMQKVCEFFLTNNINRSALVLAVGGGVIGDLTGFCASITMRGVPYIQIPTSLLAQVDSSVGGKTGINTPQGKNLVGSFYQPAAVIIDIDTLKTLPKRELLAGYAEVLKYGLIQDSNFFNWLENNGSKIINLDKAAITLAVELSCKAKADVVEADEQERGRRALLNLGHTFGHALEAAAGYDGTLLHGEGVSIGMLMAFELSYRMDLCPQEDVETLEAHLQAIGLPTHASLIEGLATNVDDLIKIMKRDKKVVNDTMVFVLVNGIGEAFLNDAVPENLVREVLRDSLGGETKEAKGQWSSTFSSL